jgi:hypothetical protein
MKAVKRDRRPKGNGRLCTLENADRICAGLEAGKSLRQISKDLGFSGNPAEISRWGNDPDGAHGFAQRYARAMVARWEMMAEEVVDIADEKAPVDALGHVDTGWVQQQRLRSDNRKWLLSKAMPRKYGDKVEATVIGDPSAPLLTRIELVAVPPRARIEDSQGKTIDHEPDDSGE